MEPIGGDQNDDGTFVPFTDILFNALLGFAVMVFVAFSLINPATESKAGAVDLKAELVISATWPDNSTDDIDLYVMDPSGNVVWFKSKEAGLMHLDRDDRGALQGHTIDINGRSVEAHYNQETVTIRGFIPGEYIANVVKYENNSKGPVPVSVEIQKVNPILSVAAYQTVTLENKGDEKTAARFTLDAKGNVSNVSLRQKSILQDIFAKQK
ncbi:MAG: hypothetical protein U1E56_02035 [Bauldia sp.]